MIKTRFLGLVFFIYKYLIINNYHPLRI